MDFLRRMSSKIPLFEKIESKYKVKREYLLLGSILFAIVVIMSTPLGPLITSTLGILLPLRETLVVLKQVNPSKDEMKHLLVFWIIFGVLTGLDSYSGSIIRFIPLFYTIKFILLLYIGPYKFRGGKWMYDNVLSQIPEEWYVNAGGIDSALQKASEVVKDTAKDMEKKKTK
ncbi:hypothetical protein NGRA_1980 [Nosema granulosis]|uniref:Protein YOP1 n=1 Tax=Nosema granulosis TaxID=83296 RepID=A0A9P6KZ27_9MICR|nr:hypothetical protein NGRA_1980 [Nosema granulosis]